MKNDIKNLSGTEIYKLAVEGEELFCPKCGSKLEVLSDDSGEKPKPHTISCSKNFSHFYIYYEDAEKVREIRKRMDERIKKVSTSKD